MTLRSFPMTSETEVVAQIDGPRSAVEVATAARWTATSQPQRLEVLRIRHYGLRLYATCSGSAAHRPRERLRPPRAPKSRRRRPGRR
jgi:hypothetical protein